MIFIKKCSIRICESDPLFYPLNSNAFDFWFAGGSRFAPTPAISQMDCVGAELRHQGLVGTKNLLSVFEEWWSDSISEIGLKNRNSGSNFTFSEIGLWDRISHFPNWSQLGPPPPHKHYIPLTNHNCHFLAFWRFFFSKFQNLTSTLNISTCNTLADDFLISLFIVPYSEYRTE